MNEAFAVELYDLIESSNIDYWVYGHHHYQTDDSNEFSRKFISFYAIPDRVVFARISSIKRIIFCWDPQVGLEEPNFYQDNFGIASNFDGELLIPSAIFLIRGSKEPMVFNDLNPEGDFLNLSEESFENPHFLRGGFISLPDEDGEQNYIPVANIEYMEVIPTEVKSFLNSKKELRRKICFFSHLLYLLNLEIPLPNSAETLNIKKPKILFLM